jgi:outer membrane protein assembly factor BamB
MVLVLVGLLGLPAAAQPPVSLDPAATIEGTGLRDVQATANRLYVLRLADENHVDVQAYRLRDGSRLWSARLDAPVELVDASDERVVVNGSEPGAVESTVLIGLDAANGAEVWRRSGYVPGIFGGGGPAGVIVADPFSSRGNFEPEPTPRAPTRRTRQLVGFDMRTGAERWRLVTPPGTLRSFLYSGTGAVRDDTLEYFADLGRTSTVGELAPDGTLTVRSTVDGAVVRTAKIDMPPRVDGFDVSGDRLIAYEAGEDIVPTGALYDLRTGHRLWALPSSEDSGPVWWCGAALCSGTENSISMLDPDSGRVRWRLEHWVSLLTFGDHLLAMVRNDGGSGPTKEGAHLIDANTGRVVRTVGAGWEMIGPLGWPSLVAMRRIADGGTVVLGRIDAKSGAVTVFGRAERWFAPPDCFTNAGFLVCRNAQLTIWRLPS